MTNIDTDTSQDNRVMYTVTPFFSESVTTPPVRDTKYLKSHEYTDGESLSAKDWVGSLYNDWLGMANLQNITEEDQSKFANTEALPMLDKINSLPDEVLELLVIKGKEPSGINAEDRNQIIKALEGYDKDWFVQKDTVEGKDITRIIGTIQQRNVDVYQGGIGIDNYGYLPDVITRNNDLNSEWAKTFKIDDIKTDKGSLSVSVPILIKQNS